MSEALHAGRWGLSGHQILLEGLVADILSEHFGEGVELVGVVLLRNGAVTFADLMRICNIAFLATPRDSLNPFCAYSAATGVKDSLSYKAARDALLVLIHYGLVTTEPSPTSEAPTFSINPLAVINRLSLPVYMSLYEEEHEKSVVETLLKRGMMKRHALVGMLAKNFDLPLKAARDTVQALTKQRVVVTATSVATSTVAATGAVGEDEVVLKLSSSEMYLGSIKRSILEYARNKYDDLTCKVLEKMLSVVMSVSGAFDSNATLRNQVTVGELSVADLTNGLDNVKPHDLISCLIRMQQAGLIAKKQFGQGGMVGDAAAGAAARKKRGRALNTKQMQQAADELQEKGSSGYFDSLLEGGAGGGEASGNGPIYTVRLGDIVDEIQGDITFTLVRAKFGQDAARIFELLSTSRQKLESSHVADICAVSREDAVKHLHAFSQEGICRIQEVPKAISSGAAASGSGGLSAMMRAVASSFWLYHVDHESVRRSLVSLLANSMVNLRRRFRYEVNRQCKIEDRATLLTQAEQEYLGRVHVAQDILEANGVDLVESLVFLMIRTN